MKWIVGVDLRPSCEGALAWADWVVRAEGGDARAIGVHALELGAVPFRPSPSLETVVEHAGDYVTSRGYGFEVRVVEGRRPAEALAHAVALHRADAVAIGRRSTREGDELVRLGRVARRVLRRLPAPVVVCPADLRQHDIPPGPVLVAAEPDPHCVSAVGFAHDLAQRIGRRLTLVSVLPPAFPPGITYLPTAQYHGEASEQAVADLDAWIAERGIGEVHRIVGEDPVVPTVLRAAAEVQACAIVCGSRILSATDRLTQSSVGSTLAGTAPIPVIVVPP